MSLEESPINLYGEHNHNHLLSSQKAGWDKLDLIYELEPAGEMPEAIALTHVLVVAQGEFKASFQIEGKWHEEQYLKGDVALISAGSLFPKVKIDRDVPLIDLFLPPDVLLNAMGASAAQVELRSQFKVQDPLIQQIALALKTELAIAGEDSRLYANSMATALGAHLLRRYGVKNSVVKQYRGGLTSYQSSSWLLQNRRYLGLSMAISHGFHAIAIAGVAILTSENMVRDNFTANLGYIFILLMTITSFKRPAAILGRRNWKILHTLGMYYLWLSFTVAFGKRLGESWLFYAPWVAILISALILRLLVVQRQKIVV